MWERMRRVNDSIERALVGERRSPLAVYRELLRGVDAAAALHLGSGRDKHGVVADVTADDVVSLDPDHTALGLNENDRTVVGDGATLPFARDTFDLVFSEYVFEHLPAPWRTLDEIDRVLRPGGSVLVLVPNPRHYYARIADHTPFWFHEWWLKSQGHETTDVDTYPTAYNWGTMTDIDRATTRYPWRVASLYSYPGPTGYTKHTPFHVCFTLLDKYVYDSRDRHVSFLVHYEREQ